MTQENRTVEVRFHQGPITHMANTIFNVRPPGMWPDRILFPFGARRIQVKVAKHRYGSWVEIDGVIAWEFTWTESNNWTIEEFYYNGENWRLEYRTRWPEFEEGSSL